jgi:hypothetical protein
MLLHAISVLLSAFPLLQLQPPIGRYLLPCSGGTAPVGTTCPLFFRALFLGAVVW